MDKTTPPPNCQLCPRLATFRDDNRKKHPEFFNAPVPHFGNLATARLAIIGLAPGLKGANRTGRVFTGDYAGDLLFETLLKTGFASGEYRRDYFEAGGDSLQLNDCAIINSVRCVPPQNKPETSEIINCNEFLQNSIEKMPHLRLIIALGLVAHTAILRAFGLKLNHFKFAHGAVHKFEAGSGLGCTGQELLDSYHCSRYNTQTGRLSEEMFTEIFAKARFLLDDD